MKDTKAFYKSAKSLLLCLLSLTIATGCLPLGMDGPYDEEDHATLKPESHYFDFGTTHQVTLNVDYGKMGSRALIQVSIENPSYEGPGQEIFYKDNAVFKTFCDANGRFNGNVILPAYADSVYIHTTRAGLPKLMGLKVTDRRVDLKLDYTKPASRGLVNTDYGPGKNADTPFDIITDNNGFKIWKAPTENPAENIYTIVNWEGSRFGQVISFDANDPYYYWGNTFEGGDNQGLIDDGDFDDPYEIDEIQYFLWDKNIEKPSSGLPNHSFVSPTDVINTVIPKDATDENGRPIDGVEVWMTFISEAAQNQNAIGYYYYENGKAPKNPNDLKIYIAIPNASIGEEKPFVTFSDKSFQMYYANFAPIAPNKRIQLLYHDEETGTISKKFPVGYTIGYFIASAETKPRAGIDPMKNKTMKVFNKSGLMFYSNYDYNDKQSERFIALNDKDKIIYGMEDGGDGSYEDILFTIETNPHNIAINQDRPSIDIEHFIVDETTHRTYAFEDIWPDGGDYDMNDVVIDHQQTISFINDESKERDNCFVTRIEDKFTVLQPGNAATYVDAFAIQLPNKKDYYSECRMPPGAIYEDDTQSIILFTHAMSEIGKTFTVTRFLNNRSLTKSQVPLESPGADGVIRNSLNPYIISKYDEASEEERTEIHLPKHSATSRAHTGKIGSGDD
ncbi:MAG: LruC domain-containing protein, partial [Duncaniella sp.]|nr:LruC domain-containing protein [Duncaniella sp.]